MNLCKYKNILGEPGKDIHYYRLFGVAIMDVIITIIAAYLISIRFHFSFIKTLIVLFIIGIILHRLFCVTTTIDKYLFSSNS